MRRSAMDAEAQRRDSISDGGGGDQEDVPLVNASKASGGHAHGAGPRNSSSCVASGRPKRLGPVPAHAGRCARRRWSGAYINMLKVFVGAGILGMPYAFREAGWLVRAASVAARPPPASRRPRCAQGAILGLIVVASVSDYSCVLLLRAKQMVHRSLKDRGWKRRDGTAVDPECVPHSPVRRAAAPSRLTSHPAVPPSRTRTWARRRCRRATWATC